MRGRIPFDADEYPAVRLQLIEAKAVDICCGNPKSFRPAAGEGGSEMRPAGSYTRLWKRFLYAFLIPATMWGHAVLVDSTPHDGAAVSSGTLAVLLSFNSRVDPARSALTLDRPGLASVPVAIDKNPARPSALSGKLSDLPSGSYKLHWQVLAVDGHITRGVISFSVK